MPKKTPEEILAAIERSGDHESPDAEHDPEMERILAMRPDEVNAELEKAGMDMEALAKQEEALFGPPPAGEKISGGDAPKLAPLPPLAPRRRRLWAPIAVAAGVLAPVGYVVGSALLDPSTMVGGAADSGAAAAEVEAMRSEAAAAMEAGHWARCLEMLDLAKQKDPEGDRAPVVVDARRICSRKLGRPASGPP